MNQNYHYLEYLLKSIYLLLKLFVLSILSINVYIILDQMIHILVYQTEVRIVFEIFHLVHLVALLYYLHNQKLFILHTDNYIFIQSCSSILLRFVRFSTLSEFRRFLYKYQSHSNNDILWYFI